MVGLIKYFFLALFVFANILLHAQQDPMFSNYMFNTLAVNPGYAGSRDALTVVALHRSQWIGLKGAPTTQTLTAHTPFGTEKTAIGLSVINDKIGPVTSTSINADFAFRVKINDKSKLAFGLKGGLNIMSASLNQVHLDQPGDASFVNNIQSKLLPNFGFGIYYSRDKFYAGISTPKLLEIDYRTNNIKGTTDIASDKRHHYIITGGVFRISNEVIFKPTTLIKITNGAPMQADMTLNFIIRDKFSAGLMYRTGDALGALIGLKISDQFQLGYSFDWSYGFSELGFNSGSHEIMLCYDLIKSYPGGRPMPRYF